MATGKSDDELIQHDNKMRIGTRSGKLIIVDWTWLLGDKAWRGRQWQRQWLRDTAWRGRQWQHLWLRGTARCVHHWPLPLTSTWARIVCGQSLILLFTASHHLAHTHRGSRRLSPFTSSTWSSSCASLLALDSPFLFPALPHVTYLLPPLPEVRGKPAHSAQREYGLHRRVLPLHRLWAQGPRLLRDRSRALHAAPGLAAALLQQSLFCGPRLRWRYTRRHAPPSTSSASL